MKNSLTVIMVFALLVSMLGGALSETNVLTVDLTTASMEELEAAKGQIETRLTEIKAASLPVVDDTYSVSGNGTQILDGVNISVPLSRMLAVADKEMKITLYSNGDKQTLDGGNSSGYRIGRLFDEPMAIDTIMVETQGAWTIEFSTLGLMQTLDVANEGSYVTDMFVVEPPKIIAVTFEDGDFGGYCYAYLYSLHADGRTTIDQLVWQELVIDKESFDCIIKPEDGVVAYILDVSCPHDTKWTVKEK